ncbi:hypothetical protein QEN19_004333 [Hanseniaspora menglaensis]
MEELAAKLLAKYKQSVLNKIHNTNENAVLASLKNTPGNDPNFINLINHLKSEHCYIYYNSDILQSLVLETINIPLIYDNIDLKINEVGTENADYEEILVKELLRYFKDDFFKWVNQPDCSNCGKNNGNQNFLKGESPNWEEKQNDPKCGNVEIYQCKLCGSITRYPRYNSPEMLLQTRSGRCGEWAAMFMYFLVSFQLNARYIWNKEDHVWCEYYSTKQQRWIHLDSCEKSYDEPFIYAKNWNKKMSYVIAFGNTGVIDVSKKYVDNVNSDNKLNRSSMKSDDEMVKFLSCLNKELRRSFSPDQQFDYYKKDELEYIAMNHPTKTLSVSSPDATIFGRQSGSAEWVQNRGEGGS